MKTISKILVLLAIYGGTASAQFAGPWTAKSMNGGIANCSVINNGYTRQLYVGSQFQLFGTYVAGTQDFILENQIMALVQSGQCINYDLNFVRNYVNAAYFGRLPYCRLVTVGAYNQLYVYGQFQGNYLRYSGDATLVNVMTRVFPTACQVWY